MKPNLKILVAGLAIVLGTNVIVLGGVAYNRSGEPDALVELTDRELSMQSRFGINRENSGLALRLSCRVADSRGFGFVSGCYGSPDWLDRDKLIELGFDIHPHHKDSDDPLAHDSALSGKVYLVLEYDGATYRNILTQAEAQLGEQQALLDASPDDRNLQRRVDAARRNLDSEQHRNSRLFAIDAGLDMDALRARYPDKGRYIILKGLVRPVWTGTGKDAHWQGRISGLLNRTINIPLEHRAIFEQTEGAASRRDQNSTLLHYKVRVAFGKRAEPWVMEAEAL